MCILHPAVHLTVLLLGLPLLLQSNVIPDELQGRWEGVRSAVRDTVREFKPGEVGMTFGDGKLLATGILSPTEVQLSFRINDHVTPKQLDYWLKSDLVTPAIYEVKGRVLTIVVPRTGRIRPTSFLADSTSTIVLTFQKQ